MRGREVGIVDALDDGSFVDEALMITDSCDMVVKVLVAVGLIDCGGLVSELLPLLIVLGAVERKGVAELSGKDSVTLEPLDLAPVGDIVESVAEPDGTLLLGPADVGAVVSESLPFEVFAPGVSEGPALVGPLPVVVGGSGPTVLLGPSVGVEVGCPVTGSLMPGVEITAPLVEGGTVGVSDGGVTTASVGV